MMQDQQDSMIQNGALRIIDSKGSSKRGNPSSVGGLESRLAGEGFSDVGDDQQNLADPMRTPFAFPPNQQAPPVQQRNTKKS